MKSKTLTNASWIIGCKLIKAILTLVVTMVTARYLGPSRYGIINYAASLASFFTPFSKLGLDSILVHEVVTHPDQEGETVGTSVVLSFISGLLCMVGMIVFVNLANAGDTVKIIVCAIYSLILIFQALELIQYWFYAKLLAKYTASAMLCSYILVSAVEIALLLADMHLYWVVFSIVADYLVISIILWFQYKRKGEQKLKFSWNRGKEMLAQSKAFILSSLMIIVFSKTDSIMISMMLGDAPTGYYAAAVKCAGMTSFVFAAIMDSARPTIFERNDNGDKEGYEKAISSLYNVITYLALLQSLVMTLFAELVIRIMYGSEYLAAVPALRIVVWYTTFSYYGTIRDMWILSEGKQKYLWKINISGAIANVVLNAILIPLLGINGAAIASLTTQFFTNVIIGYIIKPISYNNRLLVVGLNPKITLRLIKKFVKDGNVNKNTERRR